MTIEDTVKLAVMTAKAVREGRYRDALKCFLIAGIPKKAAIARIKKSRLTIGHEMNVAGGSMNKRMFHSPWCQCGWHSEIDYDTFREAEKIKCPVLESRFKKYGLENTCSSIIPTDPCSSPRMKRKSAK